MGCLAILGFAGLVGAGAFAGLSRLGFDASHAGIGGGIAAFLALLVSGFFSSARQAARERRLILRCQHGELPEDGELLAAVGRVYPLSSPLHAPFSGAACVAYEYQVKRSSRSNRDSSDFNGLALAPSAVRTPAGEIRLLAWIMLDRFPQRVLDGHEDRARARRYLESAPFEQLSLASLGRALSSFKDLMADDDGSIRKDFQLCSGLELEGRQLQERHVPVGAEVCAIGLYSSEKRGLVSALRKGVTVQLSPGDAQGALRGATRRIWGNLVGGAVMFTLLAAAAFGALSLSQGQETRVLRGEALEELLGAARDGDVRRVERALGSGTSPDAVGKGGLTALMLARDAPIVRLLTTRGAHVDAGDEYGVTPLMQAARAGRADVVRALLDAGARVDARTRSGRTALDHAREAGQQEMVRILEAARR